MRMNRLGNSDLVVSAVGAGTWAMGGDFFGAIDDKKCIDSLCASLDHGVNLIDTAPIYGKGHSETLVGQAIKGRRDKVVLCTKVGLLFDDPKGRQGKCLQPDAIEYEIEQSLRRLGTDYIDLYQIHWPDVNTPIEETMEALDSLVRAGKVRALGASAMYGYQFFNMQLAARDNGWTPFVSMQNHYNLLYREDERELIPICTQQNVARTPYSPLAAGRLSRLEWDADTKRSRTDKTAVSKYDSTRESDYGIVLRVHELAQKHAATMTQISLAWQFARGVASPIIGATKARYLDDAAGALDVRLSAEDVAYLEELYVPHRVVGAL